MKSSEIIQLSPVDQTPSVTQDAFEARDEILLSVGMVASVTNPEQATEAASAIKELKDFTRTIESARKDVKAPFLRMTKQIDQLAKDLILDLETEAKRIGGLIGDYQAEQDRIRRKAAAEAAEKESLIQEEAAEKARKAEESGRQVEKKKERIEEKTFEKIAKVRAEEATAAPAKIAGLATRKVVKFEVEDIHALAASRPELVKMEPNTSAITAILKSNPTLALPGIRHWTENTTVVR